MSIKDSSFDFTFFLWFSSLWGPFQVHQLQLVLLSPSCLTAILVFWQIPSISLLGEGMFVCCFFFFFLFSFLVFSFWLGVLISSRFGLPVRIMGCVSITKSQRILKRFVLYDGSNKPISFLLLLNGHPFKHWTISFLLTSFVLFLFFVWFFFFAFLFMRSLVKEPEKLNIKIITRSLSFNIQ